MVEFRLSTESDYDSLRELWKICFGSDREFLSLYFSEGIHLTRTYVIAEENEIHTALSLFNLKLNGMSGRYVYGVCTHPSQRGKHYAVQLLQHAESKESDAVFFITRPASPTLFEYYDKAGYTFPISRSETIIEPSENPLPVIPKEIDGLELYSLRSNFLTANYFSWGLKECQYIIDYIKYCKGCCLSFGSNRYLIGYPEDRTFLILESNIDTKTIAAFVKTFYSSCERAILYSKANNKNRKPFALLKTTNKILCPNKDLLFSFSME